MRIFFKRACVTTLVAAGAGLTGFFIASAVPAASGIALASSTSHVQGGCSGAPEATATPTGASKGISATTPAGTVSDGTTGTTGTTGTDPLVNVAALLSSAGNTSGNQPAGSLVNANTPVSSPGSTTGNQPAGSLVNASAPVSSAGGLG